MAASSGEARKPQGEILPNPGLAEVSENTMNWRPVSLASSSFFCMIPNTGSKAPEHEGPTASNSLSWVAILRTTASACSALQAES